MSAAFCRRVWFKYRTAWLDPTATPLIKTHVTAQRRRSFPNIPAQTLGLLHCTTITSESDGICYLYAPLAELVASVRPGVSLNLPMFEYSEPSPLFSFIHRWSQKQQW